jgi:magnesium chelatase accessory protein
LVVGHSAGAAIALQLVHDGVADHGGAGVPVIGFNPALMPFPGLAAQLFPSLARLLFVNPLVPRMLAGIARLPGNRNAS